MFDETLYQSTKEGKPFVEVLGEQGIKPGIKVDTGLQPLPGTPGETATQGLDGLGDRMKAYREQVRPLGTLATLHGADAVQGGGPVRGLACCVRPLVGGGRGGHACAGGPRERRRRAGGAFRQVAGGAEDQRGRLGAVDDGGRGERARPRALRADRAGQRPRAHRRARGHPRSRHIYH